MITTKILANLKILIVAFLVAAIIWFYKDYSYQKAENIRQTENASQLRKADILKYASQLLGQKEIIDYLQYQNPDLKKKLEKDNINLNRIASIVSQSLKYKDTSRQTIDISKIVEAIKQKIPASAAFKDSTACLVNKGFVKFENDSLKVIFTSREFNNKSDAVAYWERRQWSFLGIKSRFLGKKQFTAKNYSDCGETKIMKIEKIK
jgi:hypothetical protein